MATTDNISFAMAEDGRTLIAHFAPDDGGGAAISKRLLKDLLGLRGFGALYALEEGLTALAECCKAGTDAAEVPVAELRDSTLTVSFSKDLMEAYVTVTQAYGGEPLDRWRLLGALTEAGVAYGVMPSGVQNLLALGYGIDVVIARGTPAVAGKDTRFEQLVTYDARRGMPKQLEDGTVDFLDLGTVITVEAGQPLLRRHAATPGEPGTNVRGEPIAARPGRDIAFAPLGRTVVLDEEDANLLRATTSGLPQYGPNWVKVEPVLTLKNVDLSTGNIRFDGSVVVRGTVQAGLSIWAAADVLVDGIVEGATIEAGGSVELRSGMIGQGVGRVTAKGPISARFLESATVETQADLHVLDQILYCEVSAGGAVEVRGGRRPQVLGGHIRATQAIRTVVAGSPAGIPTVLEVGSDPYLKQDHERLTAEIAQKTRKHDEVIKAIVHLQRKPAAGQEQVKHFQRLGDVLAAEIAEQQRALVALEATLTLAADCQILIRDQIYSGVRVRLSDQQQLITYDVKGCSFKLRRGEIIVTLA